MRHPAKFREDRYQNPFRGFGAPGCQNLAFQLWPFPLLWLFVFTTFAFFAAADPCTCDRDPQNQFILRALLLLP